MVGGIEEVLTVVPVAVFMAGLDMFIVSIGFPRIEADFRHSGAAALSWVLNAYAIVFAALLVPAGPRTGTAVAGGSWQAPCCSLPARPGPARVDRYMPDVPPPEECQPLAARPVPGSDGLGIEHRPAAAPLPLSGSNQARIVVWMRLGEDRPIDAAPALVLADGAVPALYGCLNAFVLIPAIELGVQFADIGAATRGPWVLGVFGHLRAADGYSVEDAGL